MQINLEELANCIIKCSTIKNIELREVNRQCQFFKRIDIITKYNNNKNIGDMYDRFLQLSDAYIISLSKDVLIKKPGINLFPANKGETCYLRHLDCHRYPELQSTLFPHFLGPLVLVLHIPRPNPTQVLLQLNIQTFQISSIRPINQIITIPAYFFCHIIFIKNS